MPRSWREKFVDLPRGRVMRFKTDENLPVEVPACCASMITMPLTCRNSRRLAQWVCQVEGRALVTCDLDFADIRAYPRGDYHGIIVLRPAVQSIASRLR